MKKNMSIKERDALCFPCESESCIFSQDGECRMPLVTGNLPVVDENGCLAGVASEDWKPDPKRKYGVHETIAERAVFLWRCMCKLLGKEPEESEIWGVNATHIRLKNDADNNAVGAAFNDLAGAGLFTGGYLRPSELKRIGLDIETLRKPEELDVNALWDGITALAKFNYVRCQEKQTAPLFFSDGNMLFVKEEDAAEGLVDIFQTLGWDAKMGYFDPETDRQNGEVCCTTGYWYVDVI